MTTNCLGSDGCQCVDLFNRGNVAKTIGDHLFYADFCYDGSQTQIEGLEADLAEIISTEYGIINADGSVGPSCDVNELNPPEPLWWLAETSFDLKPFSPQRSK